MLLIYNPFLLKVLEREGLSFFLTSFSTVPMYVTVSQLVNSLEMM